MISNGTGNYYYYPYWSILPPTNPYPYTDRHRCNCQYCTRATCPTCGQRRSGFTGSVWDWGYGNNIHSGSRADTHSLGVAGGGSGNTITLPVTT